MVPWADHHLHFLPKLGLRHERVDIFVWGDLLRKPYLLHRDHPPVGVWEPDAVNDVQK